MPTTHRRSSYHASRMLPIVDSNQCQVFHSFAVEHRFGTVRCCDTISFGAITHRQTKSEQRQGKAKMEMVNPMNRSAVEMAPVRAAAPFTGPSSNASTHTVRHRQLIVRKRLIFCMLRNWVLILLVLVALIALILILIMHLQPCEVVTIPWIQLL